MRVCVCVCTLAKRKERFCKQNGLSNKLSVKMSQQISIQLLGRRATLWNSPNGLMLSDWYVLLVQLSSAAAETSRLYTQLQKA